jgi:hypothetical protein
VVVIFRNLDNVYDKLMTDKKTYKVLQLNQSKKPYIELLVVNDNGNLMWIDDYYFEDLETKRESVINSLFD